MDELDAGLRSQDYHEGLRDVQSSGLIQVEMARTILIGKAASLATHLKAILTIESAQMDAFHYMAADLGIGPLELDQVLKELRELDYVRLVQRGSELTRIEVSIPEFREGYIELGKRWSEKTPHLIERAAVDAVNTVALCPLSESALSDRYGLKAHEFSTMVDIASNAGLLSSFDEDSGEKFYFSPLTVEENPQPFIELAAKYPADDVVKAVQEVQAFQGFPINATSAENPIHLDAYLLGALLPVQVNAHGEERSFLFTPRGNLAREERVVLDKARALLACVRFGQGYSQGTRIRNPEAIIDALLTRKQLGAHPDHPQQYGLLVTQGIGWIEPARGSFWIFHFNDSPENVRAAKLALEMLQLGQATNIREDSGDFDEDMTRPASYRGPTRTRSVLKRAAKQSQPTNLWVVKQLSDLVRGIG